VPISKENPCRKILGAPEAKEDLLIPTDFSLTSTRKARYYSVFQNYEDEICRLLKQIDGLNNEIMKLKVYLRHDFVIISLLNIIIISVDHQIQTIKI
jgi:hypothetical protein